MVNPGSGFFCKMNKYFGTDGIRGAYGSKIINEGFVQQVGLAIGKFLKERTGPNPMILVGRDTRPSGPSLQKSLTIGLNSAGIRVLDCGVVPSPALAFGVKFKKADFGVMLTASHNQHSDNGIKCFSQNGTKLSLEEELHLEEIIDQSQSFDSSTDASQSVDLLDDYRSFICNLFPQKSFNGLNIVLDLANGATSQTTPKIFEQMGASVSCIHQGDGLINEQCGSEHLASLQKLVKNKGADLGIAHDGDGDRVRLIDNQGVEVDGDQVLGILALHAQKNGRLNNSTFVTTIHSNSGLQHSLLKNGIDLLRSDVGDRQVALKMSKTGANWGGESSGHIIATDYLPTGDGLIAALLIALAMTGTNATIRELANEISLWPSLNESFLVREKIPLNEIPSLIEILKSEQSKVGDNGRILLRYSGTEPKIRLLVEGREKIWVKSTFNLFKNFIQKSL
jgi:phosphoglucosamine mutase